MFDMRQHVDVPTHRHGGTLDLVMTFADYELQQVSVDPGCILSDHKVVTCQIPVTVGQEEVAERIVRGWRRVDHGVLRRTLQDSPLCHPVTENVIVDELFAVYDSVLCDIADRIAPQHSICRRSGRLAPWFDARCRQARGTPRMSTSGAPLPGFRCG